MPRDSSRPPSRSHRAGDVVIGGLIAGRDRQRVDPDRSRMRSIWRASIGSPRIGSGPCRGAASRRHAPGGRTGRSSRPSRWVEDPLASSSAKGRTSRSGQGRRRGAAMISANCRSSVTPTTAVSTSGNETTKETAAWSGVHPAVEAADRNAAMVARACSRCAPARSSGSISRRPCRKIERAWTSIPSALSRAR